ncbi:MAG TPA: type VI secretion system contractile sheath large subunit [Stellaceae bacterium]|jgi:type VI secretion system protein ImpD
MREGSQSEAAVKLEIDRLIAAIDDLVTEQVNAVIHHARFQALEASWRSVHRLMETAGQNPRIKVKVLDISWAEVCRDLQRAIEFDHTQLFRKVYEDEFGMPGGEPYGLLVGDYQVAHRRLSGSNTDDIAALQELSRIGAAAFAPIVVSAAPELFGLDSFAEFFLPRDLPANFRLPEFQRWSRFQDTDDARFIGIALPRILARQAYRDDDTRIDGFRFAERSHSHDAVLWGNAAYAFAGVVIRAFDTSGWFTHIRGGVLGIEEGGLVEDLDIPWFETDAENVATIFPAETIIRDVDESTLSELGFIPMVRANGTSLGVFCGNASVQRARTYDRLLASVNARLSSMLQYVLCISRFAHYLKIIGRDTVGSTKSPSEIEAKLQRWIIDYVSVDDYASLDTLARYPLREARIEVKELPGKPGAYYCTAHLQPHFQLERVETSFRLVTELVPA